MKSIAVWVQKGGTSKTSTAGGLAFALKSKGRVLLIDADPQGNLSSWIHPEPFKYELADVVSGAVPLAEATRPIRKSLDLVPTFAIGGSLKDWAETSLLTKSPYAFQDLAEAAEALNYQYLIYDMSPGASVLERSIIATVDECVPVVRPETFSVDGLQSFEATIQEIRKNLRSRVSVPRLVVGAVNRSFSIHVEYLAALRTLPYELYDIGQTTKLPEAQGANQFLQEYDPENRILPEYAKLAEGVA